MTVAEAAEEIRKLYNDAGGTMDIGWTRKFEPIIQQAIDAACSRAVQDTVFCNGVMDEVKKQEREKERKRCAEIARRYCHCAGHRAHDCDSCLIAQAIEAGT